MSNTSVLGDLTGRLDHFDFDPSSIALTDVADGAVEIFDRAGSAVSRAARALPWFRRHSFGNRSFARRHSTSIVVAGLAAGVAIAWTIRRRRNEAQISRLHAATESPTAHVA